MDWTNCKTTPGTDSFSSATVMKTVHTWVDSMVITAILCTGSVCDEESLLEDGTGIAAFKTRIRNLPSIHYVYVS